MGRAAQPHASMVASQSYQDKNSRLLVTQEPSPRLAAWPYQTYC